MIRVGKKWDPGAQYVARPSPLGNPFVMARESDRDRVCDQYAVWLHERIAANDPRVMHELRRLFRLHRDTGTLILGCYCAPKRCHADAIKAYLDSHL